ncbi:MAG: hypothetical protein AAGC81_02260 [Pseudomonadota bacterium]
MHTLDPVDGHGARVAVLALKMEPCLSREAIIFALTHDYGEFAVGDFSNRFKKQEPKLAKHLAELERDEIARLGLKVDHLLNAREARIVHLADKLDAWLWMIRHEPGLRHRKEWRDQLADSIRVASELRVHDPVLDVVEAVTHSLEKGIPA